MRVMESNAFDEVAVATRGTFDAAGFAKNALATPASLAAVLDHTLLKPEATRDQVLALCHEAAEHRFACAMVNPTWVPLATSVLAGTGIPVGVVVGFPLGASLSTTKRDEAREMVKMGARELDMVLNIGMLKSGLYDQAETDVRSVVEVGRAAGAVVKVILETCLLSHTRKVAGRRDRHQFRRGLPEDKHRLFHRRRHRGRCGTASRHRRRQLRGQGIRRHPHFE